jgi:hypothetical protein
MGISTKGRRTATNLVSAEGRSIDTAIVAPSVFDRKIRFAETPLECGSGRASDFAKSGIGLTCDGEVPG